MGTGWQNFGLGPVRLNAFRPLMNQGILCTDGAQWSHARGLVKPSFARDQLNHFESTERHV